LETTLDDESQTPSADAIKEQDEEQMREGLKEVTFQDDEQVDEESPVYADDKQEYMHWHFRLNHPTHKVMCKMANQCILPRQITRILKAMEGKHTKPPMCNDCYGAKATRRPWRGK
jgi:trehalose-6-phosphatase